MKKIILSTLALLMLNGCTMFGFIGQATPEPTIVPETNTTKPTPKLLDIPAPPQRKKRAVPPLPTPEKEVDIDSLVEDSLD